MPLELHEHDDMASPPQPLDALLGPARDRYFGAGYREVHYFIESATRVNATEIEAAARVEYPKRWSAADDGSARAPHLSSVDAVVLPLLVAEQLAQQHARRPHNGFRVESIELRAGTSPWLDMDAVPVKFTLTESEGRHHLSGVSGNIRFKTTVVSDRKDHHQSGAALHDRPSVYGRLFRQTQVQSTVRMLDTTSRELEASHVLEPGPALRPGPGAEAGHWPAPTVIDYLVTMGQLTQALVYASAGTTRSKAGPLWMRTMSIAVIEPPEPLLSRFETTTRIVRDRMLSRAGERLHEAAVECVSSSGVRARSSLAYWETRA